LKQFKSYKSMKFQLTLPKDEQFFQSYAGLIPTLYRLGFLAQLLSALTEIGVLFSLIYASLTDIFPQYALPAAIIGAAIGTAMLEVGLRKFLPYSFRAILYKRFDGLHLAMSLAILAVTIGLLAASGLLSFQGSREMVEQVAPPPKLEGSAGADSLYREEAAAIEARFTAQIAAAIAAGQAGAKAEGAKLERLESREKTTGRSYATSKSKIREKMAAIEAEALAAAAALEASKGEALATAEARRTASREKIEASNDAAKGKAAARTGRWGYGLAWFTVLALLFVVCSIGLNETYLKGADIEERAEPTQYFFQQSVFADFLQAIGNRWQYVARSTIQRIEEATPPPPLPTTPAVLYDAEGKQVRIKVEYDAGDGEDEKITLPLRRRIGFTAPASGDEETPSARAKREKSHVPFIAHEKHEKREHETPESRELKQRLKLYKKRLGGHKQKADALERKGKPVPQRTLDAIENNRHWINHYERLLSGF
jgi:parvulin-like peptidyl-prolyl isomerase